MDQKSADYVIDPTANQTQNSYLKKTLQFLVPISIISFLVTYFSVLPLIFHQLHFYSSIFPFFAHALDRKCMFLICNGILAFLANNMKLNTSALNYGGFMKRFNDEDRHEQLPQMVVFQENAASMDYVDHTPLDSAVSEEKEIEVQQEQDDDDDDDEERENEMVRLESEEWGEDDDDDDEEIEENEDDIPSVNDMRVSTEDLNKKFDEFIRKMKEEIRIEARQQYMIVV